jgi:hypothetical protein
MKEDCTHDSIYLNNFRETEQQFSDKLCLKCGRGFKDSSGLCGKCKEENKRK